MASVGTTPSVAPRSMSEEQSPSAIKSAMSLHAILAPTDEYAVKANSIEVDAFLDATAGKTADADHGVVDKTEDDEDMEIDDDEDADMDDVDEDDANRTREFVCLADEFSECMTGQYKLKLSRKVISNHFGRNKGCTREIKDWPLFCRKHYQRATYQPDLWQRRKVDLILRQFDVIERIHPGTTYTVSLKKSEEKRLDVFARALASGMSQAQAELLVANDPDARSGFQAPIALLREIDFRSGKDKTIDDVKSTLALINTMLREGDTKQVPAIEFLPQIPGSKFGARKPKKAKAPPKPKAKKTKSKVTKNSKAKTPSTKAASTKTRVSKKGGVQKTSTD